MDKTLRQILRSALLSTVKPDNRDIVEGLIEQTAKEIESLPPPQQAVSDEWSAIKAAVKSLRAKELEPSAIAHKLRAEGMTIREIAKSLGFKHPGSVTHLLSRNPNESDNTDVFDAIVDEIQSFVYATDNQMLIKGLKEAMMIVLRHRMRDRTPPSEAKDIVNWIMDNLDLCDNIFYPKGDDDGDQPMEAEDVVKAFRKVTGRDNTNPGESR